jgi:hypothetical protein
MMKAVLGSALGGLAAGAIALVASAQGRTAPADPWVTQASNVPQAMTVADSRGVSAATTNAPTLVQCEPQQEAVLRRSVVAGREVAEVTCVSTRPIYAAPAAYLASQPVYSQSDIVTPPVVRTQTVRPRTVRQTVYRDTSAARQSDVRSGRSWKKTALIIGGSTGAGAGVGALAGGKKGALIGAAIGGGAASIYEATKRR